MIQYSGAYISSVERAQRPPSHKFVTKTDEALKTGGTLELLWLSYTKGSLIEGFPEYSTREREAIAIRLFEIDMIPGILQTVEFATAYEFAAVRRGDATQEQANERLSFLAVRQRLLNQVPTIHAVLDESCLLRPIGGHDVMAQQLGHLEQLSQQPNMVIQVAPFSLREERPLSHPVVLLTLPNRSMVSYTETLHRGYLERDAETVAKWARGYDRLQAEASNRAESLAMIRKVRKELESHG